MREKRLSIKLRNLRQFLTSQIYIIVCGVIILGLGYIFLLFPHYSKLKKLRNENEELVHLIDQLQQEITDYERIMHHQEDEDHFYEKIARDELGVAKENEIVVDITK